MIIRSTFHDYYDAVAKQGVDRDVVYERKPETIENFRIEDPYHLYHETTLVVFCRQVFPFVYRRHMENFVLKEEKYCYSMEEIDAWEKDHLSAREYQKYLTGKERRYPSNRRKRFQERFTSDFIDVAGKALVKLADERGCPILGYDHHRSELRLNPKLSVIDFWKIKDCWTAYQELYQYQAAMARPEKPIPEISNLDMRDAKGFDKFSFRKAPQGNR